MTASPTVAFQKLVDRHAGAVDKRLEELLAAEDPVANLHDGVLYALGLDQPERRVRGKRVRPVLCLATAEALGARADQAMGFACAIELMHNFALVHDDIEDGDTVRRDRPCTYRQYGLAHGINIGDYLFCKVWSTLLNDPHVEDSVRLRLLRLMSETLDHTHIGQGLDISARSNRRFSHRDYFRLIREKTGYYLAAPMLGGAVIAAAGRDTEQALHDFGLFAGPLFQITDDLLDLSEGKGREAIGSDIREGKRSFLVAEITARAQNNEELERLYDILDKPREQTATEEVAWVVSAYERHGVIQAAHEECARLLAEGLKVLDRLPEPLAEILGVFAMAMTRRER